MNPKTLLYVDDDQVLRSQLARAFASRGLLVRAAAGYDEAVEHLESVSPDLAIVDMKMQGKSGIDVLRAIGSRSPATRSIILTGYGSIANAVEAMQHGAVNYVTKPADADQILAAFDQERADLPNSEEAVFNRPSLAESEWNHIQKVLVDCDGNITRAAKILDIPRRTLQRKLKKRAP